MEKTGKVVGIDISKDNIRQAREFTGGDPQCEFHVMDAVNLHYGDNFFDRVICVQNGISAFHVDPAALVKESIRVARKGGIVLFSSYAERFWDDRLEWFRIQARHGLIGEIDDEQTKSGIIVCKDGFRAITFSGDDFKELALHFDVRVTIHEVDQSSIFCEMIVK